MTRFEMRAVITLTLWSLILCLTSAADECPTKYYFRASRKIGTKCVYAPAVYASSRSYHDARAFCQNRNMQLISVHSDDEMRGIMDFMRQRAFGLAGRIWLGLRRSLVDKLRARWDDGTPLDYVNWKADVAQDEMEQCAFAQFTRYAGGTGDGRWDYVNCNYENPFLCMTPLNSTAGSTTTVAPPVTGYCKDGWSEFGNNCYFVYQNAVTFEEANKQCKSWNSYLASVHSDEEQNYITALVGEYSSDNVWIGYNRGQTRNFIAVSNEKVDKTYWLFGRPIQSNRKTDCVSVIKSNTQGGSWIDLPCNTTLASICKKPKDPAIDPPSQPSFPDPCQTNSDYVNYANACYRIYGSMLVTFNEAEIKCKDVGGHLLSVTSIHEHALLKYLMKAQGVRNSWIGMTGTKKDYEVFRWLDQEPMYFTKWATGQPSVRNETQCVYQTDAGDWYATSDCDNLKSFACEIDKIKERPNNQQRRCPDSVGTNWIDADHESNYCYFYNRDLVTFPSAQFNCDLQGGNLVSIHSDHELKLLAPLLRIQPNTYVRSQYGYVWIGVRKTQKNNFDWVDDSPMDFMNWVKNISDFPSGYHLCGTMHYQTLKWEPKYCDSRFPYICSIPKVSTGDVGTTKPKSVGKLTGILAFLGLIATVVAVVGVYFGLRVKRRQRTRSEDKVSFENALYTNNDAPEVQ